MFVQLQLHAMRFGYHTRMDRPLIETLLRRLIASCDYDVSALASEQDSDSVAAPRLPGRVKVLIAVYASSTVMLGGLSFIAFLYGLMNSSDLLFMLAGLGWVLFMALLFVALAFVKKAQPLLNLETLFSPKLALTLDAFEYEFKDLSAAPPELKSYLSSLQLPVATQLIALLHLQSHQTSSELDASEPARELERLLTEARVFRASLS